MIINLGDAPFKAFVTVTYPKGTCTVSGEGQTYTHTGGGTHTFTVKKKGTYTVQGVYNSRSSSAAVTISRLGQAESAVLSYDLHILVNGVFQPGYGLSQGDRSSAAAVTPTCSLYPVDGAYRATMYRGWSLFVPNIDLTDVLTLEAEMGLHVGTGDAWLRMGVAENNNTKWADSGNPLVGGITETGKISPVNQGRKTFSFDVSTLSGLYELKTTSYFGAQSNLDFYNIIGRV